MDLCSIKLVLWHLFVQHRGLGTVRTRPDLPSQAPLCQSYCTIHFTCCAHTSGRKGVIKMFNRTLDMLSGDVSLHIKMNCKSESKMCES